MSHCFGHRCARRARGADQRAAAGRVGAEQGAAVHRRGQRDHGHQEPRGHQRDRRYDRLLEQGVRSRTASARCSAPRKRSTTAAGGRRYTTVWPASPKRTTTTGSSRPPCSTRDADHANKFFAKSKSAWQKCAGTSLAVDDRGFQLAVGDRRPHGAGRSAHPDGDAAGRRRLGLSARPFNGVEHDRRNLGHAPTARARRLRRWPSTSPPTPPSSDGRSASRISSPVASVGSRHGCLWHPGSHGPGPESLTARRSCDRFVHRRRRTAIARIALDDVKAS